MTRYLVIYEQAEDGGWGAYSPDVPGCVACGDSQAEVEDLMHEALPTHLEAMREAGQRVPQPHCSAGLIAA
jgi:predicted RNase H-like HicB family nuclease